MSGSQEGAQLYPSHRWGGLGCVPSARRAAHHGGWRRMQHPRLAPTGTPRTTCTGLDDQRTELQEREQQLLAKKEELGARQQVDEPNMMWVHATHGASIQPGPACKAKVCAPGRPGMPFAKDRDHACAQRAVEPQCRGVAVQQ